MSTPERDLIVGGQAVIEGVMMRTPNAYAIAVRKADGTIVNTAARLCQAAKPGEIIVSETTITSVSDKVEMIALPPMKVKGKLQALRVYNVIARKGDQSGFFTKELTRPG